MTVSQYPGECASDRNGLINSTVHPSEPLRRELLSALAIEVKDEGRVALVLADGSPVEATVAVSCLVRPIVDDRVLVHVEGEECFVLAVLERTGPNYATLALPGRGNLAIEAENVAITARRRLSLRGERLDIEARALGLMTEAAHWIGKALDVVVQRFHVSAKTHETTADLTVSKAVDRVAVVDRTDSLRAAAQTIKIDGVAAETSAAKVVAVQGDLRIDGKRISLG